MDKLVRVSDVARAFDVTDYTVREWLKAGKMKGTKINGHWRVSEQAMKNYAQEVYGENAS